MTTATVARNPLLGEIHAPDLSRPVDLADGDRFLLALRGLDDATVTAATDLWSRGRDAVAAGTARDHLRTLSVDQLAVLQKAAGLADPIATASLDEEGAENLLLPPSEAIDRNGDGIVEQGAARRLVFPPPDASPALRRAWQSATAGMDDGDVLTMMLPLAAAGLRTDATAPTPSDGDFDWNRWIADAQYTNDLSRPRNGTATWAKTRAQWDRLLAALRTEGLA